MPNKKGKSTAPASYSTRPLRRLSTENQSESFNGCSCDDPDSADNMVQCDQCLGWQHYACANVDSFIRDEDWVCQTCAGKNFSLSSSFSKISASAVNVVTNQAQNIVPTLSTCTPPTTLSYDDSKHSEADAQVVIGDLASSVAEDQNVPNSAAILVTTSITSNANPSLAHKDDGVPYNKRNLGVEQLDVGIENPRVNPTVNSSSQGKGISWALGTTVTSGEIYANKTQFVNSDPIISTNTATTSLFRSSYVTNAVLDLSDVCRTTDSCSAVNLYGQNKGHPRYVEPRRLSKTHNRSRSSKASSIKFVELELQKLEEEKALIEKLESQEMERKKKREEEYLARKYEILSRQQEAESEEDSDDGNASLLKVSSWLEKEPTWNCLQSTGVLNAGTTNLPRNIPTLRYGNQATTKTTLETKPSQISHKADPPQYPTSFPPKFSLPQNRRGEVDPPPVSSISSGFRVVNERPAQSFSNTEIKAPSDFQPQQNQTSLSAPLEHTPSSIFQLQPMPQQNQFSTQYPVQQGSSCTAINNTNTPALTRNQIAARQLMSRDLHAFGGNPEEWPLFISDFNRGTELCAFTEEENLVRLNRALKGEALTAVRSLLMQPNCVKQIIATLKMLFGRPEIIIHTQLQKIRSTPPPTAEKLETIVAFALSVQNLCATIEASGLVEHMNNPNLLQELTDKLPPAIRLNWATHKHSLPLSTCTLSHFSKWIYQIAEAASGVLVPTTGLATDTKLSSKKYKEKGFINAHYNENQATFSSSASPTYKCHICSGNCPSIPKCNRFLKMNRTERWSEVRKHRLCRQCLSRHANNKCKSTSVCGKNNCVFKHHQLLHNDSKRLSQSLPRDSVKSSGGCLDSDQTGGVITPPKNIGVVALHSPHNSSVRTRDVNTVLFRIVPVILYGNGIQLKILAFLDEGSSLILIDDEIARKLRVKGEREPVCLHWTGNMSRFEDDSKVFNLQISSTVSNAEKYTIKDVHTVRELQLPYQTLDTEEMQRAYAHLKGITIEGYNNDTPRLLIGLNNARLGLPLKTREGGVEDPCATKTRLGWVVHGVYNEKFEGELEKHFSFYNCDCSEGNLQRLVKTFITSDNFGATNSSNILMPLEDARALQILKTHTVLKDNRFETSLLWKYDQIQLPDSFPMAKKRLECLQKKMLRDPTLAKILNEKIDEYVLKGYARKLSAKEVVEKNRGVWYLPIFPVHNPNKHGKLRIVWDAAASTKGISLNSVLLKGPDQLTSLTSVIMKFRENRVAICGDIQEMFHQVMIREEDQHFQRFLWSKDEHLDTYVMTVMTFGATCSPCTAQFVKNTNAERFADEFPRAARSIKENHYVDDLMDSVATEEEAIKLAKEIRYIHKQGGFHIRNWISNSTEVLKALSSQPTDKINLNMDVELGVEKVLGMWWCTSSDCFTFKLTANPTCSAFLFGARRPTKREVLRTLMTIFDPLGLLAQFLMYIKILLQEIWRSKIDWDVEIEDAENEKWLKWIRYLPEVEKLKIPRCYTVDVWSETQLHVFVDASENGFAAVAYVRNVNGDSVGCSLIGSKTRVAPLKSLSIPRLELQAALLGARLAKTIAESHTIQFKQKFFWSDSKNVLSWLRSDHRRYRQFVAFRVSEILDLMEISEWRWVPTKLNVADDATKWQKAPDLRGSSRWFVGPEFLKLRSENWPKETSEPRTTTEELKPNFINVHTLRPESVLRFREVSDWRLLLRSTAYILAWRSRISKRKQDPSYKRCGYLTREELQSAENMLIKVAQGSAYEEEIADLKKDKLVQKNSPIFNLCPFLDENLIIRANGRVKNDIKQQQIILPKSHAITTLIIQDFHRRYKHQNHETVINELRQKYHIYQLRTVFKKIRKSCQSCKNAKAQPRPPIMAQLPAARLSSFCRPFSFVGVDYFGPMNVLVGRRKEKRWGVLITCLTVRAVHIEIAHSLTTDSCILSLRNFVARRGTPIEIYSDNGTNFVGAERELREALERVDREKLAEKFSSTVTKWHFIPPGSPHMGGSWERMVRSIKTVLYSITLTRNPSDELLRSMLIEAESIVNSRPLTYIPIESENQEALTPNHFLLGSSSGEKPFGVFNDSGRVLRQSWLTSQQFADHFWRRWVGEYLPTITRRTKWFTPAKPVEIGDIVLIVDPNNPRGSWPKGRIIKIKTSSDGQVRSASVQTQSGVYERPIIKLAVLDVGIPESAKPTRVATRGSVMNQSPQLNRPNGET